MASAMTRTAAPPEAAPMIMAFEGRVTAFESLGGERAANASRSACRHSVGEVEEPETDGGK